MIVNTDVKPPQGDRDDSLGRPQSAWLSSVAAAYMQGQQYAKARPLLELLILLNPLDMNPVKQMAYLHYQQANYSDAIEYCLRYELNQQGTVDRRLYLLRSICHLKRGEQEQALEYHERFSILGTTR